ncbi:hypothetical protein AOLI_G00147970 [Acnodon oligacanthus]
MSLSALSWMLWRCRVLSRVSLEDQVSVKNRAGEVRKLCRLERNKDRKDVRNPLVSALRTGPHICLSNSSPGYSDQNFHMVSSEDGQYMLKVMNSADSQNLPLLEVQTYTMNFLRQRGLPAQTTIPTVTGQLMSLEKIGRTEL